MIQGTVMVQKGVSKPNHVLSKTQITTNPYTTAGDICDAKRTQTKVEARNFRAVPKRIPVN
jgi:hypothetical protein